MIRCPQIAVLFLVLLAHHITVEASACKALNEVASKTGVFIPGNNAGRVVIGKGRLQFYSAPSYECKMQGVFVIEDQTVDAYTEYKGFTSVVYLGSKKLSPVLGWVRSDRLRPNGLGIALSQK
ncbi:hypothetical protein [Trinickia diaoshuihuensis]|uniref:hypothetical protein n=1 Tax=Trinickia diaoshuihuensis TaxID=2292265 RepID=UPI0013C2AC16|nr:hypothetical protein [Trinickia diaoshuihuensis]